MTTDAPEPLEPTEPLEPLGTSGPAEPAGPAGAHATVPATDELAFDVDDLPGGAAAALEAVLMVADEPIAAVRLASVLALPTDRVEALLT